MVSKKTFGGILAGAAVGFGGILYLTIQSLTTKSASLGCAVGTPSCQAVATGMSVSHLAVGFLSAILSLGVYFLIFHKDKTEEILEMQQAQRTREEQVELLSKVMTPGEKALLSAIVKEPGILQATLCYRTNLTPGRVSQILEQFENQKLVSRKPEGRSYRVNPAI